MAAAHKPYVARCAYQWMVTAVVVKRAGAESGFGFAPDEPLLRTGDQAETVRIRFEKSAGEIMLRQHRTHLYTIFIAGWYARLFRWDRNGAVVSHPIDIRTDWKQLFNFIYRLARASPAIQGFDPTVTLATAAEVAKLRAHEAGNEHLEEHKKLILENIDDYPIYKVRLSVPSPKSNW